MTDNADAFLITGHELAALVDMVDTPAATRAATALGLDAALAEPGVLQAGYATLLARELVKVEDRSIEAVDQAFVLGAALASASDTVALVRLDGETVTGVTALLASEVGALAFELGTFGVRSAAPLDAEIGLPAIVDRIVRAVAEDDDPDRPTHLRILRMTPDADHDVTLAVADLADAWPAASSELGLAASG